MRNLILLILVFSSVFALSKTDKKPDKNYYNETFRPQFHFTPEKGILSDPAGLVYYGGEYHLFYQYKADTTATAIMQWGHAVSTDLIGWDHLNTFSTGNADGKGSCSPYTGSAVVDENNVTHLQQGEEKTILLYYTGWDCGQCIAYSNDKGRTWKTYEKNPVINPDKDNANGPRVFFDNQSGKWIMTLYRRPDGIATKQGISIYNSTDLIHWDYQSHVEGFSACADLYQLTVENQAAKKWVMAGANNEYLTGTFDGKTFTPETKMRKQDLGKNFQSPHSFTNLPEGKIIQIAWMRGGQFPGMPFNGQLSFPCELFLRNIQNGTILCRKPVTGLEKLYDKDLKKKEKNIIPGIKGNLVGTINGDALLIKATLDPKTADGFGFIIRNGKKSSGTILKYEPARKMLDCLSKQALVDLKNGKLELEILVDRASIEVFANGGEVTLSGCFNPTAGDNDIILWTQGGELFVDNIEIYTLKSAWNEY